MPTYHVKIGFWLRAYDGFDIEAGSDTEAVSVAKAQALEAMESTEHPQQIETDQHSEGIIRQRDASVGITRRNCVSAAKNKPTRPRK